MAAPAPVAAANLEMNVCCFNTVMLNQAAPPIVIVDSWKDLGIVGSRANLKSFAPWCDLREK